MVIDIKQLQELARNLYFDMTQKEYETLQKEFEIILEQMELIGKIDGLDSVEPMVFPYIEEGLGLREDEPTPTLETSEVLKNSADTMMDMVKVKKVVG